ncbi:MAG: CotH kinase family protein [Muribaculaceae bacterium]|nr:CotH kinase family protein [Muribaculaceae bacterium]
MAAALCWAVAFTGRAALRGDANGNGTVDIDDVNLIINIMLNHASQETYPLADIDGNKTIDIDDMNIIINEILGVGHPRGRMVGMGEGKDSVQMQRILNYGLEVLDIQLNDGEWPTTDSVTPPPGAWGRTIANPTKVPGRMRILLRDSVLYDTGEYIDSESGMTLRIRGNTSAWHPKKPYKIKLQKKADLLHRDSIDGRDKDWLLLYDEKLYYMLGFEVGRMVGMTWTPGYRYVNVVVNNQYEGMYLLIESVKRNTDCRLDVTKQGYIFEHDQYWWNEPLWLPSMCPYPYKFTFKYPDPDVFTEADSVYMTDLTHRMELSYYTHDNYPEVIDVPSFARFCLVHDIMGTSHYGANRYYIKRDKSDTTLVEMPLVWDFDREDGDSAAWSLTHRAFFYHFFQNSNRTFVEEYAKQWNQVRPIPYSHIDSLFTSERKTNGYAISMSTYLDNTRWNTHHPTYNSFTNRPAWIKRRIPWLDAEIQKLPGVN